MCTCTVFIACSGQQSGNLVAETIFHHLHRLEEIESVERHPGKTLPKLKNPTTLSIIREHGRVLLHQDCTITCLNAFICDNNWSLCKQCFQVFSVVHCSIVSRRLDDC